MIHSDPPEPRCRCTPEERSAGHRHRCAAGPPTYIAVGEWAGLTTEEIEAALSDEPKDHDGDHETAVTGDAVHGRLSATRGIRDPWHRDGSRRWYV